MVLLLDRAFFSSSWKEPFVRRPWLYAGFALAWVLVITLFLGAGTRGVGLGAGVSTWKYLLTQSRVVLNYAALVFIPYPLIFDRGISAYAATASEYKYFALTSVIVISLFLGVVNNPRRWVMLALFFVILAPSSSFIPISRQPMAENRLYLASATLLIPVAFWFYSRGKLATLTVLSVLVLGATAYAHSRSKTMASLLALNHDTISKVENNPYAWINYGRALIGVDELDEAEKAFEIARKSRSAYAHASGSLGLVAEIKGEFERAIGLYKEALADRGLTYQFSLRLGTLFQRLGESDKAREYLDTAAFIVPNNPDVHILAALIALDSGDLATAQNKVNVAAGLDPHLTTLNGVQMAIAYGRGDYDLVRRLANKGHEKNPNDSRCLLFLALTGKEFKGQSTDPLLLAHAHLYRDSVYIRRAIVQELNNRGYREQALEAEKLLTKDLSLGAKASAAK
ncbi:tetratricopeptide repeat protein [Nibricoccus sp. IMCC34717]|uniref:tetratricopeptide repeat protein n=1 Tax=Nibricoccus sp. IMCC34717 TaxID=3034021 RepID=UPI0038508493